MLKGLHGGVSPHLLVSRTCQQEGMPGQGKERSTSHSGLPLQLVQDSSSQDGVMSIEELLCKFKAHFKAQALPTSPKELTHSESWIKV